jgi:hypothetical protein
VLLLSPPVAKKSNQTLHASCVSLTYPIRLHLQLTALGFELLREGEAIFDELRDQWGRQIGPAELENLETHLTKAGLALRPCASTHPAGYRETSASRSS